MKDQAIGRLEGLIDRICDGGTDLPPHVLAGTYDLLHTAIGYEYGGNVYAERFEEIALEAFDMVFAVVAFHALHDDNVLDLTHALLEIGYYEFQRIQREEAIDYSIYCA
jgi:hypothetical protein